MEIRLAEWKPESIAKLNSHSKSRLLNGGIKRERGWNMLNYASSDPTRKGSYWKFQAKIS